MNTKPSVVAAIVGIDGCGKSSVFRGALERLSDQIHIAGVGDVVLSGGPDEPLHERPDVPASGFAHTVGKFAKGLRWQGLYKNLKFLELTERTRMREYLAVHEAPDVILTDGESLINSAAWAAARFYRQELSSGDEEFYQALSYLTGEETIPLSKTAYYLRRSPELLVLNRLRLGRFSYPDLIFLLELDPAVALERIRARGRPLQSHETEPFLAELARAYDRVCRLLETRRGIPVVRIRVDELTLDESVDVVGTTIMERIARERSAEEIALARPDRIEVVATTMSGSIQDQRKVGRIGPEFRARTMRPVRVHPVDSHAAARSVAHDVVVNGGRILISAGGGGTFNAVLEGAHVDGAVPPDLLLAFLRKGSADLMGKVLNIPDDLPEAVQAIVDGIETDSGIGADILSITSDDRDGKPQQTHLIGFGGFGLFGEVPRISESRLVKYYKGFLGTLFGDFGPFYVALALATVWWQISHLFGRVSPISLTLDDEQLPPELWATIVVINGDLGHDFPLGKGLDFASGTFRVVAIRYDGVRRMLKQIIACRTADILEQPEHYRALVREVRSLRVMPNKTTRPYMVNIDGLRMTARGPVHVSISGNVRLIARPAQSTNQGHLTEVRRAPEKVGAI
ncbi:MAG: diacylglycerol kinase family protein [Nitrolancea sp.]